MRSQEDFEAADRRWGSQLRGRSLVIEADANPDEARIALEVLGRTFRLQSTRSRKELLLRRYRAALLVGVASVATLYDVAGLWPYLEQYFGPLGQADREVVAEAFRAGLDHFGLARFHFPRRNIDEMLMHGGIPGPRTDEFIELLARRSAMTEGLNGRQFCQWVGGLPFGTAAAHGLDAPTWRFLGEGREVSEDVVDRSLQLLDRFAVGPVTESDLIAFPAVMHRDLLRALDELAAKQLHVRKRRRDQVDLSPRIFFDPAAGLRLRLPSIEHVLETSVDWTIAMEGSTRRLPVAAPWPGDPVIPRFVVVSRPVKQVALTAHPSEQTWLVDIVDPDDALLIFDGQTGEWIPSRNSLPKSDIWLAVPNPDDQPLQQVLEVQGSDWAPTFVESPLGWAGWTFARASVASVDRLRIVGQERWRYVSSVRRPRIEVGQPVPMVRTPDGGNVFNAVPYMLLPATPQSEGLESAITWAVSVRRVDGSTVGASTVLVGNAERLVELPVPRDQAVLGVFDIQVQGPLGRGAFRRVAVAEGLAVSASTSFRPMLPSGRGLAEAHIELAMPRSEPVLVRKDFSSNEASGRVKVRAGAHSLELQVEIPAMRVNLVGNHGARGGHAAVGVDIEELASTHLQVALGRQGPAQLAAFKRDTLLQTVTAMAAGPSGIANFNLAQLSSTIDASGGATLLVGVEGARIPVAHVRRKQLIAGARFDGRAVVLDGLASDEPLEIGAYPRYAPWRGPTIIRCAAGAGRFELPGELEGEGEIRILVEVEDPWAPHDWPTEYPHRTLNTADVVLGELSDARGGPDTGFRPWLRRAAPCPTRLDSLPFAIELYADPGLGKYRTPLPDLQRELAASIRPYREYLPAAYSRAAVRRQPVDLFIDSDTVLLPPGRYEHGDDLWTASPLLALLSAGTWPLVDPATAADIERILGESALQILENGEDSGAALGRFNSNTQLMARWPSERVEAVWRSANPVPGRLLDSGTRLIAAKHMFDRRNRCEVNLHTCESALIAARRALTEAFGEVALVPLHAREAKPGWTNLPAYSIAFSLAARAAARGIAPAVLLHATTKAELLGLARTSPSLVEQDLILADLWLTRWSMQ